MILIELNELRHFIAIVQYGSFTNAATNIYVSQPTLSKSIKRLETKLKVKLFERSTRSLHLTDAGKLVFKQANKIIGAANELTNQIDDLKNIPSGDIKIGIPPLIGTLFFPQIAREFGSLHPEINLELIEHGAKRIEFLVEDEQIDVGIVVLPVNTNKFHILPFIEDEFMLFVNSKHPLASRDIVTINDLQEEEFILFNREFSLHSLVIDECERAGFNPNIPYVSSQWDLITELIIAELGITLFPQSIQSKMYGDSITTIPIQSPPIWKLGVITKKGHYTSFAMRSLLRFLSEQFPDNHPQ